MLQLLLQDCRGCNCGLRSLLQLHLKNVVVIDYALSGCVAMQFLQLMQQDEETALQLYHQLVQQPSDLDFLSVLQAVGDGKTLRSPFEEGQLEALAEQLQAFLDGAGQQLEQVA